MSIEAFREVNSYQPYREKGYAGMPFEAIPDGLRERVKAAVKIAAGIKEFTTELQVRPYTINWQFGDHYTDVFVYDDRMFHQAYHRGDDGIVYMMQTSTIRAADQPPIVAALGFAREKAEIIPGLGWAHGQDISKELREYMPQGPYYGMRIETPI